MQNICQPNFQQEHKENQHALTFALLLTISYAVVEAVVGWMSGSLALVSDAGHMVTDATALLLAWLAGHFMQKPPSSKHSYGLARLEVITALINAAFMLFIIGAIVYAAIDRMWHVVNIQGGMVFVVAVIGLLINLLVAFKLSHGHNHGHSNLNTRAALVHVIGDLLGSVAAIIAGAVIYFTGWMPIDPILSMVICLIIIRSVYHLLKESFLVLMEGVPEHINLKEVQEQLSQIEDVILVNDLHVWNLSSGYVALSAHIKIKKLENWPTILKNACTILNNDFGIRHITIQPEQ